MVPTSFDQANIVYDKPEGMTREECDALSCWKGQDTDGQPLVISCWKPTKEELEEINRTGRIWVFHFGHYLQPHAVSGQNPFK